MPPKSAYLTWRIQDKQAGRSEMHFYSKCIMSTDDGMINCEGRVMKCCPANQNRSDNQNKLHEEKNKQKAWSLQEVDPFHNTDRKTQVL